jgi:hypothetical protein
MRAERMGELSKTDYVRECRRLFIRVVTGTTTNMLKWNEHGDNGRVVVSWWLVNFFN